MAAMVKILNNYKIESVADIYKLVKETFYVLRRKKN